jgi:hypothetical protein
MAAEPSIFDQISTKHVQAYPFPHAVVLDVLPAYLVKQLIATRPALGQVASAYSHAERSAGQIFARPGEKIHLRSAQLLNDQFASAVWKNTVRQYLRASELAKLLSAFAPAIRSEYPHLEQEWGKISNWTIGQRFVDSATNFVLLADVQLSYHAPSPVLMVAERGPHLKVTNKLLVCQYFLRIAEDQSPGGDLLLYGVKDNSSLTFGKDQQVINRESLILAKRIEYKANTAVAFLNSPRSFQAFSEHGGTIHPCFYMNIVLEFAQPIFSI